MKKFLSFLFLVSILFACGKKKKEFDIPADMISPDSMVQVLADIHIADAGIMVVPNLTNEKNKQASYYKYIFEKHKLTPAQFKQSFDYYLQHTELLNSVYEDVINELSERQAEEVKKN